MYLFSEQLSVPTTILWVAAGRAAPGFTPSPHAPDGLSWELAGGPRRVPSVVVAQWGPLCIAPVLW